jgi:hypothetical protein
LPFLLRHRGLRLYSVLIDVSEMAGSREGQTPISFDQAELLPQAGIGDSPEEPS